MHCPKKETLKYPTSNIPERTMKKKTFVPALAIWRAASGFFYLVYSLTIVNIFNKSAYFDVKAYKRKAKNLC